MNLDQVKMFNLENKIIVITGAAGLLGRNHTHAVAAYGGIPVLIDINKKGLLKLNEEIETNYNISCEVYAIDITNENELKKNARQIFSKYKKIDGLVNNAAINPHVTKSKNINFSRLENFKLSTWQKEIDVGLTGAFLCTKYYGYYISKNKKGGSIINISSDLGLIAPDQNLYSKKNISKNKQPVKPVTYSVIKSGMIGLTKYISTYWADSNVRCNVLCPGGVLNDQKNDFLERVYERIPLKRLANSNEYQSTLIWMLSDSSSYLNGAIIPVDGGRTAW
ncbi:SDR family oxidoreductase [Pelagibacterales bacterium SAG-MED32]|nr:SDR family oxidoreductase [Pelagibacterales bacterium SAG-MED32]